MPKYVRLLQQADGVLLAVGGGEGEEVGGLGAGGRNGLMLRFMVVFLVVNWIEAFSVVVLRWIPRKFCGSLVALWQSCRRGR